MIRECNKIASSSIHLEQHVKDKIRIYYDELKHSATGIVDYVKHKLAKAEKDPAKLE